MNLTQSEFIRQALREKIERAGRQFGSDTGELPTIQEKTPEIERTPMQEHTADYREISEKLGIPYNHLEVHDLLERERQVIMQAYRDGMLSLMQLMAERDDIVELMEREDFAAKYLIEGAHVYYNRKFNR